MTWQIGERVWHKRNRKAMTVDAVRDDPPSEPVFTCSWDVNGTTISGEFNSDAFESIDALYEAEFISEDEDRNPSRS